MKTPWKAVHDWNDARIAENIERQGQKEVPLSRELNARLIKAVFARRPRTAEALLKLGASPDSQLSYEHGYTTYTYPILNWVIGKNWTDMAAVLIANKADPTKGDTLTGQSPLHEAAIFDRTAIMRLMLDTGAMLNPETSCHSDYSRGAVRGATPLAIARQHAWTDIVQMIEEEPARREEARAAAARAEMEAAAAKKKADEEARLRAEQEHLAFLNAPPTETARDIQVTSPLRLKGAVAAKAKKWSLF